MATGVLHPGWLSLESVGVTNLADAEIPVPTSNGWAMPIPLFAGDQPSALADPRPDAFEKIGVEGPANDLTFLDRIHVVPRRRDLGAVISEQEIEVEVWNARRNRAKILDDITVEGAAGITVVDHLGVPAHFPATQSEVFTVIVDEEGDPQIDNLISWVFLDVSEAGTTLAVLGFRLIPFPYPPNLVSPVSETFGYTTNLIEAAFSGMEQRVQLRVKPTGTIGYSVFLIDRREAQMAAAILFGNQPRAFGVGRWQFKTPLTVGAGVDDLDFYCDTSDIPFDVGGLVMLWVNPFVWEVLTIETIAADHLTTSTPTRNDWNAVETFVLPVVVGRLTEDEGQTWESLMALSQTVAFTIDGFEP